MPTLIHTLAQIPADAASAVEILPIVVGLLGGLSIFLYGMNQMTGALKAVAGDGVRLLLARLTRNRFSGAASGAIVTALLQSSSVTTVLLVGFISAGLMSLQQSVGVILGANVGSTVTAQLIAFRVTDYALGLITIGFALLFTTKREWLRQSGATIMGLGLLFLGMGVMSDATGPLRTYPPFIELMVGVNRPLLGILAAAVFTAIIQSSAATTGLVIVLAGQGFISLEAGIALALGSNIGTCATAVLAAIGKPRAAVQAAAVHVLFNVVGVVIWLPLLGQLAAVVTEISPQHTELEGAARLAAETPRQIANAHTLFNVANTLLFIWFTGPIAALVRRIIPDRTPAGPEPISPKFLDDVLLQTPALAIDRLRLEIARLGRRVADIVNDLFPDESTAEGEIIVNVTQRLDEAGALYQSILRYTQRLLTESLTARDSTRAEALLAAANQYAAIGDIIRVNLIPLAREWERRKLRASDETRRLLRDLNAEISRAVGRSARALGEADRAEAQRVTELKPHIQTMADRLSERLASRLSSDDPNRVEIYRLETEIIEILKRIYYFAKRVSKGFTGELAEETPDITTPGPPTEDPS